MGYDLLISGLIYVGKAHLTGKKIEDPIMQKEKFGLMVELYLAAIFFSISWLV
jgi:hypothetical protein